MVTTLVNGIRGLRIDVPTANPRHYVEALSAPAAMARTVIGGELFLPAASGGPWPAVVVVPGSLGVAPSHLSHAAALTDLGIAACVIDPFGARNVTSTVANQAQYSFAASAWDVCATAKLLAACDDVDADRIGAQGHSRGGSAVLTAAVSRFAAAVGAPPLAAVYAAYPWCGHQFQKPGIGRTVVRAVIGDQDEWCLPQQVQGCIQAMRLAGGQASCRIFAGAHHSFDRGTDIELIADAAVSPGAPTAYLDEEGAFVHPLAEAADPTLTDRDLMIYGMKAGYGRRGARIGSRPGDAETFRDDMLAFWSTQLVGRG
ncbi:MAG: prolyl oligopeptidase family serine peptidase [Pseudomonadales bacterium]